ncbi:antirepressor AbbA [Bacillus licheniformis]|nr:antirepressor AbbA [Bacillus licheniformis]
MERFSEEERKLLLNVLLDHEYAVELLSSEDEGADLTLEVHLDIGKKGMTKDLIQEMTGRITSMGICAKIKPDSYTASSYANRYTK